MIRHRPKFLIVDDFYDDPWAMREDARSRSFEQSGNWPGLSTIYDDQLTGSVVDRIGALVGTPLSWFGHSGVYRLSFSESTARNLVHTDNSGVECGIPFGLPHYSAIVYLTRPEHCKGYLSFYKSRVTGLDYLATQGQASELVELDAYNHEEMWDEEFKIPLRFNRLLLFQTSLFHGLSSDCQGFGSTFDDGRLLQAFWFYES